MTVVVVRCRHLFFPSSSLPTPHPPFTSGHLRVLKFLFYSLAEDICLSVNRLPEELNCLGKWSFADEVSQRFS